MASTLNNVLIEKEKNIGNKECPGPNSPYDQYDQTIELDKIYMCNSEFSYNEFGNTISPLITLSESQVNECLSDHLGEDINYTELLPAAAAAAVCCSTVEHRSRTNASQIARDEISDDCPSTSRDTSQDAPEENIHECPSTSRDELQMVSEAYHSPKKKLKRSRDPSIMLANQRNKHPIKPPCQNCKKNCKDKIPEIERLSIYNQFWSVDRQRRRDFLSRQVHKTPTSHKTAGPNSRRRNTLTWTLNDIRVCKTFFLHTLGFSNDEVVVAVLRQNLLTGNKNPKISAAPDPRGRFTPHNAFTEEYQDDMKNFILKFNPVPSHYNIKHAPNRRYLPIGITFTAIYNEFKLHCLEKNQKVCSWPHFYSMIKQLNLSTAEIAQDICTKCKNHEIKHKTLPLPCNCNDCLDLEQHLENKRASRRDYKILEEKCNSSEGQDVLFTVDMQKAICMPLLTTKEYYFSRKLVLFNESFVPPGKNKQAACVVWHEGESGRKAHNVATTYVYFLRKYCRDVKSVTFFLDNCNSQNKNKLLFSALVRIINDNMTTIERITLEYFESGHTFMAADAVHAAIAKKLKSKGEVYDLNDFITTIKTSRKNMEVDLIDHKDMIIFSNDSKLTYPKGFNIQNLKVIEFRRNNLNLFAKNNYNADFTEISFLKKKNSE
ncbi:uncharacterized protein LOC123871886 [Maniola jurtina]|uniref:uncharacterized protein LOC123871886 n=1 Tax=Maniola jurtina TaxID=191418 RepID=UPI001E68DBD1|nr:uncharacterized protein LOC123871886 [Maniola jurtina]